MCAIYPLNLWAVNRQMLKKTLRSPFHLPYDGDDASRRERREADDARVS